MSLAGISIVSLMFHIFPTHIVAQGLYSMLFYAAGYGISSLSNWLDL